MARRDRPDHYADRAKKEGYRARSVYKLEEIDRKSRIFENAAHVLDVGAAPGSWTQYAARHIKPGGRVVAVDLKPVDLPPREELLLLQGDVTAEDIRARLRQEGPFDLVLSDAAPATAGNRTVDAARSADLAWTVVALAEELLAPGGNLVVKLFQGGEERELLGALRSRFEKARSQRPRATRGDSFEVYLVGLGYRAENAP
ncbi:MAG: SAM-dependent methyltransferase [Spirochaetaceae bacterium]